MIDVLLLLLLLLCVDLQPLSGYGPSVGLPISPLAMDRLPILPFSPDILWRYPLSGLSSSQPPSSPLLDVKTHLPGALGKRPAAFLLLFISPFIHLFTC